MLDETKAIEAGTEIHPVLASGKHHPARVTKVHKGKDKGLVDLEAVLNGDPLVMTNGEPLVITKSPQDESGKLFDSWHLPEPNLLLSGPAA